MSMVFNVFLQKLINYFFHGARMQVRIYSVLFLGESHLSFQKVSIARILSNVCITLVSVIVSCLLNQHCFELLFIDSFGLHSNLNKHLDNFLYIEPFNHLSISFLFNFCQHQINEFLLDLIILNDLSFELICLHCLNVLKVFHLGYKVFVHVQQYVLNHNDYIFFESPNIGYFFKKVFVRHVDQFMSNWLKHLNGGFANIVIKHLSMLVEYKVVGCPVKLLIGEL